MKRPWIKMCGIVRPDDARAAVMAGAELLGLNFYAGSPRAVSFGLAARISQMARRTPQPPGRRGPVRTVAVLVDADVELVQDVIAHVEPDILQFHGDEPPDYCQHFKKPFLKAFRLQEPADAAPIASYLGGYAIGFLIDGWTPGVPGGTGVRVGLETARRALKISKRGFLAGGLTPGNVGEAIRTLTPYGVDVASGIEERTGVKSAELMVSFVRAVEAACRE